MKKIFTKTIIFILLILSNFPADIMAQSMIKIGIYDLTARGLDEDKAKILTGILRKRVFSTGKYDLLAEEDMKAIMKNLGSQQELDYTASTDDVIAELAKSLGVEQIITGSIGKLGNIYVLDLRLVDAKKIKTVNIVNKQCSYDDQQLINMVSAGVLELIGAVEPPLPAKTEPKISTADLKKEKGGVYFTRVNIWYGRPDEIFSTNYHTGKIIKAGTRVKIDGFNKAKIKFTDEDTRASYTIVIVSKYTNYKIEELLENYFSKENVLESGSGAFYNFTKEEQENIQKGAIAAGMSKDAVIMSYGYPPTHATSSLKDDKWIYWENRTKKIIVNFKDGVVVNIKK